MTVSVCCGRLCSGKSHQTNQGEARDGEIAPETGELCVVLVAAPIPSPASTPQWRDILTSCPSPKREPVTLTRVFAPNPWLTSVASANDHNHVLQQVTCPSLPTARDFKEGKRGHCTQQMLWNVSDQVRGVHLPRSASLTLSEEHQSDLLLNMIQYYKKIAMNQIIPKNEARENSGNPHIV